MTQSPVPARPIETQRLVLLPAEPSLAPAWLRFLERNRERLAPTDPLRPVGFYTLEHVDAMLAATRTGRGAGEQISFAITLRAAPDEIVGTCRFSQIAREAFHERSARVLARLGFVREGLAPRYLHIGGAWRDHVLNALVNPRYDDAWLR